MTENNETGPVEHRAERVYAVDSHPEEIWAAIATADGISSWMAPARVDPRIGGEVVFDLGGFASTGVVTAYEPNVRFAYEEPWPLPERVEDVPADMAAWFESIGVSPAEACEGLARVSPIATEYVIEAASGGSCVIRIVSSAYGSGAEWENEFFTEMIASTVPFWDRLAALLHEDRLIAREGQSS